MLLVALGLGDLEEEDISHYHTIVVSQARVVLILVHYFDAIDPTAHHKGIGQEVREQIQDIVSWASIGQDVIVEFIE